MYWILNIFGLIRVVAQRQRSYLGLVLALVAGFVVAVALVASIPLYSDAVGYRTLRTELDPDAETNPRPPFAFMFSHTDSNDAPLPADRFQKADQYFMSSAANDLGLPKQSLVRYANTDKLRLFPAKAGGSPTGDPLLWANVGFASDIEQKIEFTDGKRPAPSVGKDRPAEIMVNERFADKTGAQVGEEFLLLNGDNGGSPFSLPVRIAGIWRPRNPNDAYWFIRPDSLEDVLLVPEQTYKQRVAPQGSNARAQTLWYLILDGSNVRNQDVPNLLGRIRATLRHVDELLPGVTMPVSPRQGLEGQYSRVRLLTISLVVFSIPILALIGYFIIMVAGMVVQRQQNEIAVFRSRGVSRVEVLGIYLLEGVLLGALALVVGIYLAQYAAMLMGWTRSFLFFEPRSDVTIRLSRDGLRGGLWVIGLTLVASLLPALGAAGHTIISYKQDRARSIARPLWQRLYLDLLLLIPAYYGYRQLVARGTISVLGRESPGGDPFTNPLLILTPAFCMLALALLALRLFPLVTAGVGWLIARLPGVSGMLALRYLTRTPRSYTGPVLLLILTLSLATFMASMARTLDQHLNDQVLYDVGARMRIADLGQNTQNPGSPPGASGGTGGGGGAASGGAGGAAGGAASSGGGASKPNSGPQYLFLPVSDYLKIPGVRDATRVTRGTTAAQVTESTTPGTLLGIDRMDFPRVAAWRQDYARESLGALMNALGATPEGLLVSRGFLNEKGLSVGSKLTLDLRDTGEPKPGTFVIVGAVDYFPTLYPEDGPFFIANADYLFEVEGDMFPYEVWLDTTPGTTSDQVQVGMNKLNMPAIVSDEAPGTIVVAQERPERQGLYGLLSVGFLSSALLTGLGFLFYSVVSFQRRFIELGMLRAIGLSVRQMAVLLLWEQALIIGMGILAGTALGIGISRYFIPFLQVRGGEHPQTPPFVVLIAWDQIRLIYLIFAVLLGLALSVVAVMLLRMKIFQAVKLGEAA
jgi:putative ABC transport system permease protein